MSGGVRLIPAHAGKTINNVVTCHNQSAHPRSRGENSNADPSATPMTGSSPLTRGKPETRRAGAASIRLIPAHAGKTQTWGPDPASRPAHPRSRGENERKTEIMKAYRGSSPLTRGKQTPGRPVRRNAGLIPAHAGKTGRGSLRCRRGRAHPRSRGENLLPAFPQLIPWGSSPLTRGKHSRADAA